MRFVTLLLSCLLGLGIARSGRAQTASTYQLDWTGYAPVTARNGQVTQVPTFRGASYLPGELVGTYSFRLPGRVGEGQLTATTYEPFAPADAGLLKNATLPAGPTPALRTGTESRQTITYVDLRPVRRNPQTGQPEKLTSFQYSYSLATNNGPARRGTQRTHVPASALRQGTWYKIGVPRNGVYKLDKKALVAMGFDAGLDPRRVQVFGNAAGGMLPQLNSAPRPDDIQEIPLGFAGNNDAVFDDNEYVTFYSRGPHVWEPDPVAGAQRFRHLLNLYTDTAYYFVTVGAAVGRRLPGAPAPTAAPTATITTFAHRDFYEHDLVNLRKSGRQWLGSAWRAAARWRCPSAYPTQCRARPCSSPRRWRLRRVRAPRFSWPSTARAPARSP